MSDKSNKYGYVGVDIPAQSFGSNKGVFNPAEINELVANNQWTTFGQLELIETQTVSSAVTTVDFTSIKESIYNVHLLTLNNVQVSGGPPYDGIRLYENGVLETGLVYQYAEQYGSVTGTVGELKSTADNKMFYLNGATSGTHNLNGYFYFYNLGDNTKYSFATQQDFYSQQSNTYQFYHFSSAVLPQLSVVNGIQYFQNISNGLIAGDFSLYGIRYS